MTMVGGLGRTTTAPPMTMTPTMRTKRRATRISTRCPTVGASTGGFTVARNGTTERYTATSTTSRVTTGTDTPIVIGMATAPPIAIGLGVGTGVTITAVTGGAKRSFSLHRLSR